jgi:hypothetical protein
MVFHGRLLLIEVEWHAQSCGMYETSVFATWLVKRRRQPDS